MTPTSLQVEPVAIGPTWRKSASGQWDLPEKTLAWQAIEWAWKYLKQPDGPNADDPWQFTDEQARFLTWWYAIDVRGRFLYRRGVLRRLKGWG